MFRQIGILLAMNVLVLVVAAQEILPRFSLLNKGSGRIVVSWTNPYGTSIKQLTIQRSFDSTKNFKSILTLPDPTVQQNGYVDTKATTEHMFYRLYIQLDSGKYIFSVSKRPVWDTAKVKPPTKEQKPAEQRVPDEVKPENKKPFPEVKEPVKDSVKEVVKPKEIPEKIIYIKRRDTLIAQVGERSFRRFRDSLAAARPRDTLAFTSQDTMVIKPFVPKEVWKPSKYVFTEKEGNVKILLPDAAIKKYTLKFFEENNAPLFEIKQVKDNQLILDKSNFFHSGWFKFELYEDGVLKEKNKVFIPKDF